MSQLGFDIGLDGGAEFDPTRRYRYRLWRTWVPGSGRVAWCMLNPSTADEVDLDPTLTRCRGFSICWGYGAMDIVNLHAIRSTDPGLLLTHPAPTGGATNDQAILKTCLAADLVIIAWGVWGQHWGRGETVGQMLLYHDVDLYHLGKTDEGYPRHPLYLPKNLEPMPWS